MDDSLGVLRFSLGVLSTPEHPPGYATEVSVKMRIIYGPFIVQLNLLNPKCTLTNSGSIDSKAEVTALLKHC